MKNHEKIKRELLKVIVDAASSRYSNMQISIAKQMIKNNISFDVLTPSSRFYIDSSSKDHDFGTLINTDFRFKVVGLKLQIEDDQCSIKHLEFDFRAVKHGRNFILEIVSQDIVAYSGISVFPVMGDGCKEVVYNMYENVSFDDIQIVIDSTRRHALFVLQWIIDGKVRLKEIFADKPKRMVNRKPTSANRMKAYEMTLDENFFTDIHVKRKIGVRGHWRNQRVGKGRKETTRIWIDDFAKSGYKRLATKRKLNTLRYDQSA